jgi:AraC-like DNA-binding protein
VSYKALTRPDLFIYHDGILIPVQHRSGIPVKYKTTGLSPDEADSILSRLNDCLSKQEPYLDPEITLEKLSSIIDVPKHHLSQVINQKMGKNFNDLINEKRVEKARILLKDTEMDKFTIAAIAFEAGFNSLSSFNDVFKKYTGKTPSKFKNLN